MTNYVHYKPEWVREDFVDFIAEKFNPTWAWKRVKAQLISNSKLADHFHRIQLRPNHNFEACNFKAGQSVLVTVVVAGVRQQRSYSVVEITSEGDVVLGVRQQGIVSKVICEMKVGEVVEISQAQGEFTLETEHQHILLVASGSGITAIYSLLKQALKESFENIDLIYFHRDSAFHVELEQLSQQFPHFQYHSIDTNYQKKHLDESLLKDVVSDFEQRMTYACGAKAMMQSIHTIYKKLDLNQNLKQEYFQLQVDESLENQPVLFLRAQQEFQAQSNLLESAEQAGLKPTHGCRMGICNTCTCTKVSGSTKNMLTGEIDHGSNTQIKLCISQAISPVVINL